MNETGSDNTSTLHNEVIPGIIAGISNTRGEAFFQAITQHLASAINADFTFISRLKPGNTRVTTLAFCVGETLTENFTYDLVDTPCQDVLNEDICVYPNNICSLYPRDILLQDMGIEGYLGAPLSNHNGERLGLVVALYKHEIDQPDFAAALFQLFAGRIAAEIENFELQYALEQHRNELENTVNLRTEELVTALEQAKAANDAKGNFLATMSHELRTPINGVLGMTELLADTPLNDEQQQLLKTMAGSGKLLLTVINDILDYSKVEAGRIELVLETADLRTLLNQLHLSFASNNKNAIQFDIIIGENVPDKINTDIYRLQQILSNLLSNAFKFTTVGTVTLEVEREGDSELLFKVIDTGIGIAKDKLQRLFEPFVQADETITRNFGGTGLGLFITRGLVNLMGGSIKALSRQHQGCEFQVRLPLLASLANTNTSSSPGLINTTHPSDKRTFNHLRVLVAEDNSVNQMVVRGLLKKQNVMATIVDDGQQAVNTICQHNHGYDLIFMDCNMPILDGLAATRKIRQWEQATGVAATPIYALTAHVLSYLIRECEQAGMNGHLGKPIDSGKLLAILEAHA